MEIYYLNVSGDFYGNNRDQIRQQIKMLKNIYGNKQKCWKTFSKELSKVDTKHQSDKLILKMSIW